MSQLNDLQVATFPPQWNDGLYDGVLLTAPTEAAKHLNDLEYALLVLTEAVGSINDMELASLNNGGFLGTLNDARFAKLLAS